MPAQSFFLFKNKEQTVSGPRLHELFGELIHSYTRGQAIEDGVLIDVSETARQAGFAWPVAMTAAAWEDCVAWTEEDSRRQIYQDETGRLWDVVWMASRAVKATGRVGEQARLFQLYRVPRGGRGVRQRPAMLKVMVGPGDDGAPVITIVLPDED